MSCGGGRGIKLRAVRITVPVVTIKDNIVTVFVTVADVNIFDGALSLASVATTMGHS